MSKQCSCTGQEQVRANGLFWCEKHQIYKTQHYRDLCQTQPDYWKAWEENRGPGQVKPDPNAVVHVSRPPMPPGPGTELKKMLGCGGCKFVKQMNDLGADGCLEQLDMFIRLLVQPKVKGGKQRMGRRAARRMIEMAIKKARVTVGVQDNA
mgnify:CR=1 FL=1